MDDDQFMAFLELLMVSDPWPLQWGHEIMTDLADDQSRARGFCDWIEAYHKFRPPGFTASLARHTPGKENT